MGLIISGTTITGITLTAVNDPVSVTPTGYLNANAVNAIYGPAGTTWYITNAGLIAGDDETAISLKSAGTITNLAIGRIFGGNYGIDVHGAVVSVANAGLIHGIFYGVRLTDGGVISNASTGTIVAEVHGLLIGGAAGSLWNEGFVGGTINVGDTTYGLRFTDGGNVTNLSIGTIGAADIGLEITGGGGTIISAGQVSGTSEYGVWLNDGGRVTNQSLGAISGGRDGIHVTGAAGTVSNAGVVSGAGTYGVKIILSGSVSNLSGGSISGGKGGIYFGAAGTVTNAGVISGAGTYGINILQAGSIANQSNATIGGAKGGLYIGSTGFVTNAGGILGISTYGIRVKGNGVAVNTGGASISGGTDGVDLGGANSALTNAGTILGTSTDGALLAGGGVVTNQSGGTISGGFAGLELAAAAGTVTNAGLITGSSNIGVYLAAGGGVSNLSTGAIHSGNTGIYVNSTAYVMNAGIISATARGVDFKSGGQVVNLSTGTIGGPLDAIYIAGGAGTITNAGTITGPVVFASGFTNQLLVLPGAQFAGIVNGNNAPGATSISSIELLSEGLTGLEPGTTPGFFSGLGSQFTGFSHVTIGSGGIWTLGGYNTLSAGEILTNLAATTIIDGSLRNSGSLINSGLIEDNAQTMILASVSGTGEISIGGGDTLTATGSVAATQTIGFAGEGTLAIAAPTTFTGVIAGLGGGGKIELTGVTDATSAAIVNADTLAVQQSASATIDLSLDPSESYAGFEVSLNTVGGNAFIEVTGPEGTTVIGPDSTETVTGATGAQLAASPGGLGGIVVTGGGAALTTTTNVFIVGDTAPGSLGIDGGGTVVSEDGAVIANTAAGSSSGADVAGTGSAWRITGAMNIGVAGSGTLGISGGATVTAGSLDAGIGAFAVGGITLSGAGSDLIVSGAATVADDGTGVLSVLNGASFVAQSLTIGSQTDSSGALVVSGIGSKLSISGSLNIGTALGTGDLTVGPGAVVNASVVNLQGGVVLEGGVLDPTVFIENGGSTTGGFGTVASQFILLEGTILSNGSKSGKQTEVVQGTVVGGGTATINGSVSVNSPGILQMAAHDTIEVTGAVLNAASTTFTDNLTPTGTYMVNNSVIDVVFQDGTGVLKLDDIAGFGGTIATWSAGDQFVITGGTLSNVGVSNGNTLTVSDSGTGAGAGGVDTIIFGSAVGAGGFGVVNGNTLQAVACFTAGTRIATARGDVAVETLTAGDEVRTQLGGDGQIVWTGTRAIDCRRHPRPAAVWPILIETDAFGAGTPSRDLFVSPDHALYVDGVLIPAKCLVNGRSIRQIEVARVVYHHIELACHDVVLAEGLPAETYLDTGDRARFAGGRVTTLYPDFAARTWEMDGCAPLVLAGPRLEAARAKLARGAAVASHAIAKRG